MANTKNRKLIFLIALLSAFPPLSTDMYLPALPLLKEMWHEPLTTINMTLVAFFICYLGIVSSGIILAIWLAINHTFFAKPAIACVE